MFLKQYNYKPKSGDNSAIDTSGTASAAEQGAQQNAGRRRSSAADKFAGLTAHKRSSQDSVAADRKASFADQKVGNTGVLGSMWNNFTKGS